MTISVVQSKSVADSLSGSFTSPTTAGNTVVVGIGTENSSNVAISVSGVTLGGAADNFAQAVSVQSGFNGATEFAAYWVDPDCAGGQTTVALTGTNLNIVAASDNGWVMYEVAGLVTSASLAALLDKTATNSGTTGTAVSSGTTAATTQASEIVFAMTASQNAQSAFTSGYTTTAVNDGTGVFNVAGEQVVSATGTQSFSATQSASGPWAGCVITLKAAASTISGSGGVSLASLAAGGSGTAAIAGSGGVSLASLAAGGSGTVTEPQLLISIASQAGTDRFGNAYDAGVTVYGNTGAVANLADQGGSPLLSLLPPGMAHNTSKPQVFSFSSNTGAANETSWLVAVSGKEGGADAGIQLVSQAADNSAPPRVVLEFGGTVAVTVLPAGSAFTGYVQPGNGTSSGAHVYSGSGAPGIAGTAGDLYVRSDGAAGSYLYRCTGGSAWTAFA